MKLNTIIEGDSYSVLKTFPNDFLDIVITSPPYNVAHKYDNYNDDREFEEYYRLIKNIFTEVYRVLKSDGRICVNVPFAIKNMRTKKVIFLAHNIASILNEIGFINFELITWHKGKKLNHFQGNNTAWGSWKSPSCPSFRPMGESVLVFYKQDKSHKGKKEDIDITADEFKEWTKNSWYFDEEKEQYFENIICASNNAVKKEHPAPFPAELVERLIKLYSYKNDIILDPFNGIGTTTKVAADMGRKYIGIELSKRYCDIACDRLEKSPFRIVFDDKTSTLVNSSSNQGTLNEIFPYKESFSPNLVPYLIDRYDIKKHESLVDPFVGTGSVFTNDLIGKCYGVDTNKLAINITMSKLIKLSTEDYRCIDKLIKSVSDIVIKNFEYPKWEPYSKYAPKDKYDSVMSFIEHFEGLSKDANRFVKYVVISNLDKIFDYKRDGNGIKYRKSKLKSNEVLLYLKELLKTSLKIKKEFDNNNNKEVDIKVGTALEYKDIRDIDIGVTSPPYANMFDYFEVYKMELWTSGIIKDYLDWKNMKKSALRSNKNAALKKDDIPDSLILKDTIKKLEEKNTDISTINMLNNYFYDMNIVLENVYNSLVNDAYFFIVVGNSFYNTIPIITDEILIEQAKQVGFNFCELIICRKLSTSSQQMKKINEEDLEYLRETIIVLRKGSKNEEKN